MKSFVGDAKEPAKRPDRVLEVVHRYRNKRRSLITAASVGKELTNLHIETGTEDEGGEKKRTQRGRSSMRRWGQRF